MNAQLLCKTAEHYTPAEFVEAGRYVLGEIDLDPASSPMANMVVNARRYYGLRSWYGPSYRPENGLELPWGGRVFVNPPGDRSGRLVRQFWRRANQHALCGGTGAAVLWVGFSIEQLRTLQTGCGEIDGILCPTPHDWPRVICKKRIPWDQRRFNYEIGAWYTKPGRQPTHANYFCLLGGDDEQRARFRERFGAYGVCLPGRRIAVPNRALEAQLIDAVRQHGPLSKRALIRIVQTRTSTGLAVIDRLIQRGQLAIRNRAVAFP